MNARAIAGFLAGLLVVGLLIGVGIGAYQMGVAQGIVDAGRFPAGATVPVAGFGWHGPGIFGLLFGLFFLLLLFGLLRAAFSRGRGWGAGWGPGSGRGGYGPGWGSGPDAFREERDRRIADLHRRLHEDETTGGSQPAPG